MGIPIRVEMPDADVDPERRSRTQMRMPVWRFPVPAVTAGSAMWMGCQVAGK
jgi:hypothetical protein